MERWWQTPIVQLQINLADKLTMRCAMSRLCRSGLVLLCLLFASSGVNADELQADALFTQARSQIATAQYADALASLRKLQAQYPSFSKLASVQTRIAVLQEYRSSANDLPVFMQALDQREANQPAQAVETLDGFANSQTHSSLADDAFYVKAYIQIMDLYLFEEARISLAQMREKFPETAYADSADYLDAIALEQLGHTDQARLALRVLRDKHTAVSLPLGFRWPASGMLSRYWFERADRRLAILQQHGEQAATLRSKSTARNGSVLLDVESAGQHYSLILYPSPLVIDTVWTNEHLEKRSPPSLAVYSGVVSGVANSWARIVVNGQSVTGMISIDGQRSRLQADQLLGTMDYYKSSTRGSAQDSDTPDYLVPPLQKRGFQSRVAVVQSTTRLVPLSIVVDAAFDNYYGGQGLAQALDNLNMADGIYREHGVALTVDKMQSLTPENAAVVTDSTGTLESLLNSFRDYRLQQQTFFDDSVLVYLFTGQNTSDRTLGLAWIDTLCRVDGYDVGVTTPSSYADVLTAHEIGHSLGALHDSETACQADSGKIMWPRISSNTSPQFSSCSQEKVTAARIKHCLLDAIDLRISANIVGKELSLTITNTDKVMSATARVLIEAVDANIEWPAACVVLSPGSAECVLADLPPSTTHTIELIAVNGATGIVTAQATLQSIHDYEPINNAVSVELATGLVTQSMPFSEPITTVDPPAQSTGGSGSLQLLTLWVLLMSICVRLFTTSCLERRGE